MHAAGRTDTGNDNCILIDPGKRWLCPVQLVPVLVQTYQDTSQATVSLLSVGHRGASFRCHLPALPMNPCTVLPASSTSAILNCGDT